MAEETEPTGGNVGGDGAGSESGFSQEQVNVLMGKTRSEARDRALAEIAQKYGNLEALKKAAEAWAAKEEAEKTELEKLRGEHTKALEKKEADLIKAQEKAQELETRLQELALRGALSAAAQEMGCDPDVAWALVDRSALTIGDDGKVQGVKPALDALKKEKPQLFGAPGTPGNAGPKPAGGVGAEKLREDVNRRLRKAGRYRM